MDIKKELYVRSSGAESGARITKRAIFALTFSAIGYALGRVTIPFGAMPFGISAICASVGWYALPTAVGAVLSASGARASAYVIACAAALAVRMLVGVLVALSASSERSGEMHGVLRRIFAEPLTLRTLTAAAAAFGYSLYFVIAGGFLFYDVFSAAVNTACAAVGTLVLGYLFARNENPIFDLFNSEKERADGIRADEILSIGALLALFVGVVVGIGKAEIFGISIAVLVTMLVTFSAAAYRSVLVGTLISAACGLALDPLLTPGFVFGALVFTLLSPLSVFLGTLGAFAVCMWWGFYTVGLTSLTLLLPALLAASLVFTVLSGAFPAARTKGAQRVESDAKARTASLNLYPAELISIQNEASRSALKKLGEGFGALSDELYRISGAYADELRESRDLYGICEGAFDSACSSCKLRDECRSDCEFSEELGVIGGALSRDGQADRESVSERLRARCARLPDILDEINYNAALRSASRRDIERTEFFALDYKLLASLVGSFASKIASENEIDIGAGVRISERIALKCGQAAGAAVLGNRQKRVIVSVCAPDGTDIERLKSEVSDAVGSVCRVSSAPALVKQDAGSVALVYESGARISVEFDGRSANAFGEEEYCGDSFGAQLDEHSQRFVGFISDGMGCGREASEVSRTVAVFLQNLLPVSYDCERTVQMLNSFLRRRCSDSLKECSATVDIAEIDLIASRATFYKSGAAPTYVMRGDSVFKIRARTIPVGIISDVDIKRIELDLYPDDVIVMVSDGVTQGKEECPRLFELLKNTRSTDPRRISELVLKYALDSGTKDDVSVLVLRVVG